MLNLTETADIHYRYKMPKLESVVESSGNGIKTCLKNISKVSRALSRPPTYTARFLASELGTLTNIDEKADRYLIMGSHSNERIQKLIYSFIKNFVLCPSCSNPETAIGVDMSSKKGSVTLTCTACGATSPLNSKHKLISYIIKNPPSEEFNPVTHTETKETNNLEDQDHQIIPTESTKDQKKLNEEMKKLVANTKSETLDDKFAKFQSSLNPYLAEINDKKSTIDISLVQGLASYSIDLEIRAMSVIVIARNIFKRSSPESPTDLLSCITPSWQIVLSTFLERHLPSQLNFLSSLEEVFALQTKNPSFAIASLPNFLMWLYDKDLVTEEAFLKWYASLSKAVAQETSLNLEQLIAAAKPFIEWIQQASEDESDEEDEGDQGQIQFSKDDQNSNVNGHSKNDHKGVAKADSDDEDEESDVDIDNL